MFENSVHTQEMRSTYLDLILVTLKFRVVTLNPGAVVEVVFTLDRFFTSLF